MENGEGNKGEPTRVLHQLCLCYFLQDQSFE